jgi:hypothetical protein
MREQSILKYLFQREARKAAGRHATNPTAGRAQAQMGFSENEVLSMPQDISEMQDIQNADGSFKFMASFSQVGGSDGIG